MIVLSPDLLFDEVVHEYSTKDGERLPGFTETMRLCGMNDFLGVPPAILQSACDFGTAVHKATEMQDEGNLDAESLDPRIKPYLEAWEKFKKDGLFSVVLAEIVCWSKSYRFATTIDRILRAEKTDEHWLVEIKTSYEMPKTACLQTRAGMQAFHESSKLKIKQRAAVLLRPDGTYEFQLHHSADDWLYFLACLQVAKFKITNKIGVSNGNHA